MELPRRRRELKLFSDDGRLVCCIDPPTTPNPPGAIVLGARLFLLTSVGYRETTPYVAGEETILPVVGASVDVGPCLAGGCRAMARLGTRFCADHSGEALRALEAEHAAAAQVPAGVSDDEFAAKMAAARAGGTVTEAVDLGATDAPLFDEPKPAQPATGKNKGSGK